MNSSTSKQLDLAGTLLLVLALLSLLTGVKPLQDLLRGATELYPGRHFNLALRSVGTALLCVGLLLQRRAAPRVSVGGALLLAGSVAIAIWRLIYFD
jgi:hypothetical protein